MDSASELSRELLVESLLLFALLSFMKKNVYYNDNSCREEYHFLPLTKIFICSQSLANYLGNNR